MEAAPKQQILALLPRLSLADRVEIAGRLRLLGVTAKGKTPAVEEVHRAAMVVLGNGFPPLGRLQKLKQYKVFCEGAETLVDFAEETCGPLGRVREMVYH